MEMEFFVSQIEEEVGLGVYLKIDVLLWKSTNWTNVSELSQSLTLETASSSIWLSSSESGDDAAGTRDSQPYCLALRLCLWV